MKCCRKNPARPQQTIEKYDRIERQGIAIPQLGIPFAAATLPAAAAAAIGVYGVYQEDIHRIINSIVGNKYSIRCF